MTIIQHDDLPQRRGYYSKNFTRDIFNGEACVMWDQIIPPGGYIPDHYHPFEEILTFIEGEIEVTMQKEVTVVRALSSILIPPLALHSLRNVSDKPVRMLAIFMNDDPIIIYPGGPPEPADWD